MTTTEPGIIQLRLDPDNRKVLEQGIKVEFVKIALGEDGIFELYMEGHGKEPLPDPSSAPPVPLADSQ